jgi:hypothetical protein
LFDGVVIWVENVAVGFTPASPNDAGADCQTDKVATTKKTYTNWEPITRFR